MKEVIALFRLRKNAQMKYDRSRNVTNTPLMKRFLRQTLSTISYQAIRLTNGRQAAGLRILTYHRVTDAHPEERLCVPVAKFLEQMRWLYEHGYQTVTLSKAVRWLSGDSGGAGDERQGVRGCEEIHAPQRALVITFDDGYEDNFLNGYPAMARYGFSGMFFVPTQFVEAPHKGHHPDDRPMSWAHLEELARQGHEIGAHSVTHRKLSRLNPSELFWEVRGSKEVLEERLRHPVDFFCYPSGDYSALVKTIVQSSGYRGACSVKPGANDVGTDPFALKRTEISAFDSLWDFEKKLAGAYDWLHVAAQKAQRISVRMHQHSNAPTLT